MNCDCINKINEKLKEHNLKLCGYAFVMPDFKAVITIQTEWIDANKAPKGRKRNPTKMLASHCPFCGKEVEQQKPASDESKTGSHYE